MNRFFLCLLSALVCLPCFAQERHIATSDGVQLYVKVQGRGTPCLYIHGGPGSGSYWLEKFSGKMLEQHFQMIYLDQRGVGRSTSPQDGNYSLQRMLQDFEEVRAALGIKKWLTLSHSFGGIPQVAYAQQHPEAVSGLIMANSSLSIEDSLREALPRACQLLGTAAPGQCTDTSGPLLERLSAIYGTLRSKGLFWKMGYVSQQHEVLMDASFP